MSSKFSCLYLIFQKCPDGGIGRHEGETMYIVESLLEWKRSCKKLDEFG